MHITTFLHQFSYYCLGKKNSSFCPYLNFPALKTTAIKIRSNSCFCKNHFTTCAKGQVQAQTNI